MVEEINEVTMKWVEINGEQVVDVTPDHHRELALVDLQVLNKLTDQLGKTDFSRIRQGLRNKIMNTNNLDELVQVTEDFTAFHKTVNLIQKVNAHLHNPDGEEADLEATPLAC